jgi:hypothetical protein
LLLISIVRDLFRAMPLTDLELKRTWRIILWIRDDVLVREGRVRADFVRGRTASEQRANEFYADLQGDPEATDEDEQ